MNESEFIETTLLLMDHLFGQSEGHIAFFSAERVASDATPGKTEVRGKKSEFMPNTARRPEVLRRLYKRDRRGWDIYVAPLLYCAERRIAANALPLNALYADGDGAIVPTELPQPTATIESSPGKHHYIWALDEPIATGPGEALNRRMTAAIGCDPSGTDLAQLIRLPGTHNYKYPDAPEVRLVELTSLRYLAAELDAVLPSMPTTPPKRAARVARSASVATNASEPPVPLAPLAKYIWSGKTFTRNAQGGVDRSTSLFNVARVLHEAGASPNDIRAAIEERDVSLGWKKFSGRPDRDERFWAIVDRVTVSSDMFPRASFPCTDLGACRFSG